MGKISTLCKLRKDETHIAWLNSKSHNNDTTYFYISRSDFLLLFIRYLFMLIVFIIVLAVSLPESHDELLHAFICLSPAILSLVLLLPCAARLASQRLSQYLLVFHLFPFITYFSLNPLTIPLSGVFLLYLIFINIYVDTPPSCERKKQQANILPQEYPVGLTLLCFSGLYLTFFVWFELDHAIIFLMLLSWVFFLLSKWRWQVVALNVLGGVGLFWFFSSGFVDIKYHKNIIVRALIKISLLDSVLFIIFSLSLFINMLFWLEEWQRTRKPLKDE
ncbi:membrane protein [Yersinia similis]|uniref:Membrane protein n=1 Tax=Yersinia similis TaxID=367190 RepID=A0A0T9NYG2_9GAMM|nr:membrane protein [Yersinia similis]CNE20044.1 membrane protein [Yersinia similis]CNF08967.1 membrane protein [Yersinia similis]CNH36230.1 membrane protein [Yersinia similis]